MSKTMVINDFGQRFNIWEIPPQRQKGSNCHPAPFPLEMARGHILVGRMKLVWFLTHLAEADDRLRSD